MGSIGENDSVKIHELLATWAMKKKLLIFRSWILLNGLLSHHNKGWYTSPKIHPGRSRWNLKKYIVWKVIFLETIGWFIRFQPLIFRGVSQTTSSICCLLVRGRHRRLDHGTTVPLPIVATNFWLIILGTWDQWWIYVIPDPIPSMYGISTYIWFISMVNVGKYTIHWWYGDGESPSENSGKWRETTKKPCQKKAPFILASFQRMWLEKNY